MGVISPSLLSSRNFEKEEEKDFRNSAAQIDRKDSPKILIDENDDFNENNDNEEIIQNKVF